MFPPQVPRGISWTGKAPLGFHQTPKLQLNYHICNKQLLRCLYNLWQGDIKGVDYYGIWLKPFHLDTDWWLGLFSIIFLRSVKNCPCTNGKMIIHKRLTGHGTPQAGLGCVFWIDNCHYPYHYYDYDDSYSDHCSLPLLWLSLRLIQQYFCCEHTCNSS
jgi:hypothetical protein